MDEIGSLQQIFEKYEPPTQNCESLVGKPFGMNQCFPAFLVLIAGFFMVSIVFIVEFIWKYVSYGKIFSLSISREGTNVITCFP